MFRARGTVLALCRCGWAKCPPPKLRKKDGIEMRKLALLFALTFVAGIAGAEEMKPATSATKPTQKVAAKATTTTHEV